MSLFLASACQAVPFKTASLQGRTELAEEIAVAGQLHRNDIQTSDVTLASWRRLNAPDYPVNIYIEGDGLAWISKRQKSSDPTPTDPVALRLAAADPSPNVVYIARPCQYVKPRSSAYCSPSAWTSERFTPQVIALMNEAVSLAKASNHSAAVNLIGYSGGGNIAAVLAGQREDVASLRTVAGSLNIRAFNEYHNTTPMPKSVSAAENTGSLAKTPQIHFTGDEDKIVPEVLYRSFADRMGASPCLHHQVIEGATHTQGWADRWQRLLSLTPRC